MANSPLTQMVSGLVGQLLMPMHTGKMLIINRFYSCQTLTHKSLDFLRSQRILQAAHINLDCEIMANKDQLLVSLSS